MGGPGTQQVGSKVSRQLEQQLAGLVNVKAAQRADRVDGIKKEVGVDLGLEGLNLGIAEKGGLLFRLP